MLFRRCLDVTCFTIREDLGSGCCPFCGSAVSFGMLVASTIAPWGILERSGGTWEEHKKGDLRIQPGISVDILRGFLNRPFYVDV